MKATKVWLGLALAVGLAVLAYSLGRWNQGRTSPRPAPKAEAIPSERASGPSRSPASVDSVDVEDGRAPAMPTPPALSAAPEPERVQEREILQERQVRQERQELELTSRDRELVAKQLASENLKLMLPAAGGMAPAFGGTTVPTPPYVIVTVYYATDRRPLMPIEEWRANLREKGSDYAYYGGDPGPLELGRCLISIPTQVHETARIERPGWSRLHFKESVDRDFVLHTLTPLSEEAFYGAVQKAVADSDENDAFVFIHGYNVRFNSAAMRTAQLAYDLAFRGAAILYSWPAKGETADYLHDEEAAVYAKADLSRFLRDLSAKTNARKIHLVAHSMGNRVLADALVQFAAEPNGPRFHEIILAAADINRTIFLRDIAPAITRVGRRVTLYTSSRDLALKASHKAHEFPRVGESGNDLVVIQGADTIDASNINTDFLGHSFFAEAQKVLRDIDVLLHQGTAPDKREDLRRGVKSGLPYWWFNLEP